MPWALGAGRRQRAAPWCQVCPPGHVDSPPLKAPPRPCRRCQLVCPGASSRGRLVASGGLRRPAGPGVKGGGQSGRERNRGTQLLLLKPLPELVLGRELGPVLQQLLRQVPADKGQLAHLPLGNLGVASVCQGAPLAVKV